MRVDCLSCGWQGVEIDLKDQTHFYEDYPDTYVVDSCPSCGSEAIDYDVLEEIDW